MKLISLNIEGDKHWDRTLPFLKEERPDVFCVQEIFKSDVDMVLAKTDMRHSSFASLGLYARGNGAEPKGNAVFTKEKPTSLDHAYYKLLPDSPVVTDHSTYATRAATHGGAIVFVTLLHEGKEYVIGTTHLCVTYHGLADQFQTADAEQLLAVTETMPPHVLCGDFNMPRSINTLYKRFTDFYTDAIPPHIEGSLDPKLHRSSEDPKEARRVKSYMVDYLFTMPEYHATDVHMHAGVSDHKAIIANIEKTV